MRMSDSAVSNVPVIVTRPLSQAEPLAQKLAAAGREAVVFPLLAIEPLGDPHALQAAIERLADFAMVAFVSPNAIDAMFAMKPAWPRDIVFAVVGEGSRRALAEHGVTERNAAVAYPRDPERTDSQTLLEVLDLERLKGREVLIVRGETGRELLADELRAAGVKVTLAPAYRRSAPVLDDARRTLLATLIAQPCDWIITSSEALRILLEQAGQVGGEAATASVRRQHLIVPHVRIQENAQALGFTDISLTGSGDERLLAALQSRA
jgi:uroporphyrinogen-III synthase